MRFLVTESIGGPQEKRLLGSLLSDYNSLNRPVLNESEALMLTFGVTLQQIIDVVSSTLTRVKRQFLENIIISFSLDYFVQKTRK
jgi:hypothetical protein